MLSLWVAGNDGDDDADDAANDDEQTNECPCTVGWKMNALAMWWCSVAASAADANVDGDADADASSMLVNFVHGNTEKINKVKAVLCVFRMIEGVSESEDQCKIKTDEHDFDFVRRIFLFAWKNTREWANERASYKRAALSIYT